MSDRRMVLLLGNRRPSLAVIRSLHREGWRLAVGLNGPYDRTNNAHRSRFVSLVWKHADWHADGPAFAAELSRFLDAHPDAAAVFPIDGAAIRQLTPLREDLDQRVSLVLPNQRAIEICMEKEATLDICRRVDVPCAMYRVVESRVALAKAVREIGYPCIVKPLDAESLLFGVKATSVGGDDELEALMRRMDVDRRRLVLQRYVDGPRHNVYFAASRGRLIGAVEVQVMRTDHIDGTGLAVWGTTVEPSPFLQGDCQRLIGAMDYTGVGCAQFLVDKHRGARTFLELNPRLGANFAVVERAGLPLSRLALDLALGRVPVIPQDPWQYARGLRFAWTLGALAGCRFQYREGVIGVGQTVRSIGRALVDALRADVHITWSWEDPLPTLLELARPLTHKPATPADERDPAVVPVRNPG